MPFQKSGCSFSYHQAAAARLIIVMFTIIVVLTVMVFPAMVLLFVVVTVMFVFVLVFMFVLVFVVVFFPALLYHNHPFPHLSPRIQFYFPGSSTFLDPDPETHSGTSSIHPDYLPQGVPAEIRCND
jgi:hypothetical protein